MQRHKKQEEEDPEHETHRHRSHDAPIPPGADDQVGERAAGGQTTHQETEMDPRSVMDPDAPDPALVAAAERLGVEDAHKLDRDALLDRLSPIRHGRKR